MAENLGFNKRIQLCKKEVFTNVTESGELDNIKGTDKTGFYNLATIYKFLHPALDKYDLDLEMEMEPGQMRAAWIDCNGDTEKKRIIGIDFHGVKDVERLPLMANIVQSEGAVKTYLRRYALTFVLGLPSTDMIDTQDQKQPGKNNNQSGQNSQNKTQSPSQQEKPSVLANDKQLKAMFTLMNIKGVTKEKMKASIKKQYGIDSSKQLNIKQYNDIMKYFKGLPDKPKEAKKGETTTQSESEKIQR
ncbi:MAG: hypothetical protein EHM20_00145 [Alphaproteobacteria bacterium]|nr:MAG: hypothetical protein EHM20_00145 [Alphaproteobacteria bacterium]